MNEEVIKKINFWAALLTILQIIVAASYVIFQGISSKPSLSGFYDALENQTYNNVQSSRSKNYRNDTGQLVLLNSFLKKKIPLNFITYYSNRISMLDVERIKCFSADSSLGVLANLLRPIQPDQTYFGNEFKIKLTNNGDKSIKNIRINLYASFSEAEKERVNSLPNDFTSTVWKVDTAMHGNGAEKNVINELGPGQTKLVYVWVNGLSAVPNFITIIHDDGIKKIYMSQKVYATGELDNFFTNLLTGSDFLQLLAYILVPLGLIYLVLFLIPSMVRGLKKLKNTFFVAKK
jgi:hypothetical protein